MRLYHDFNILPILMVRLMSDRRYCPWISLTSDPTNDSIGSGYYRDSTNEHVVLKVLCYNIYVIPFSIFLLKYSTLYHHYYKSRGLTEYFSLY